MTTRILAILALALFISACESTSPDAQPTPSPTAQSAANPASTPSPEADHPAPSVAFKAGDKVKLTTNGSTLEAVVISVDDKAGKAVVKVAGETKERTVNLSEIVKQ